VRLSLQSDLIIGSLCGVGILLYVVACYWFYTVPKQYELNNKQLKHLAK